MDSQWGRIDADGTVYVKTADGEREIGSWQAGDAAAGLAFYERRYADLADRGGPAGAPPGIWCRGPAGHAQARRGAHCTARHRRRDRRPGRLRARLAALVGAADAKNEQLAAARDQARAEAIAAKERLAVEAEAIAESGTSVEVLGRPTAGHRRGVEADQRYGPQVRRGAVAAVRGRARRVRQAARPALRRAGRRSRRGTGGRRKAWSSAPRSSLPRRTGSRPRSTCVS